MKIEQKIRDESISSKKKIIRFVSKNLKEYPDSKKEVLKSLQNNLQLCEKTFLFNQIAKFYKLDFSETFPISIASELLMQAAFISDDVLDNNTVRNNKKNLLFCSGQNSALLISAILYGIYFKIAGSTTNKKINNLFIDAYIDLNYGQYLTEKFNDYSKLSLKQLDYIAFLKCGKLMSNSASIPAILVEEDDSVVKKLGSYGKLVGIALQHRDDILEFLPSKYSIGKPVLQDLFNNQPNLVLYFMFQGLSSKRKSTFTHKSFIRILNEMTKDEKNFLEFIKDSSYMLNAKNRLSDICLEAELLGNYLPQKFDYKVLKDLSQLIANV